MSYREELIDYIESAKQWPPEPEREIWNKVNRMAAHRDGDAAALRPSDWGDDESGEDRPYIVDPLPGRICGAFADLIFGEDPVFIAAEDDDQVALTELVDENDLPSELQDAEEVCSSEGEVWWRTYIDAETHNFPIIQWLSRAHVIPLLRGRTLLAAAFVTEQPMPPSEKNEGEWYLIEYQDRDAVENRLYYLPKDGKKLQPRPLEDHPETADLPEVWEHGLDRLLCGRILNRRGRDATLGGSDFERIEGLLMALNEATTIGTENTRLTAKKRVVVPQRYLDSKGNFPAGADILIGTEVDRDPDKPGDQLAQIEWTFDAEALKVWTGDLEDRALTRARVAPQLIGRHTEGAQTGPALRARLLDSIMAAHGKARYWDDELPKLLATVIALDALPVEKGGNGGEWKSVTEHGVEPPSVERRSILPEDETEQANRLGSLAGSMLMSRFTAIRDLHPDWDEQQILEEMQRIEQENPLPEAGF